MNDTIIRIGPYKLHQTCGACPEQYDVYLGGEKIAYLRLRHGYFRADVPDCGGETIYTACPYGNGSFTDRERQGYLEAALKAIADYYHNKGSDKP